MVELGPRGVTALLGRTPYELIEIIVTNHESNAGSAIIGASPTIFQVRPIFVAIEQQYRDGWRTMGPLPR